MNSTPQDSAPSQRKKLLKNSGTKGPDTTSDELSGKSRGPRAKRGEVRDRIREAAREQFISHGYDATTIREVARRAGCDAAMVSYYFGAKQRLFRECFNLPLDPVEFVLEQLKDGTQGAGERVVRHALELYEQQITADTLRILMTALVTDVTTSQRFRTYIRHEILEVLRIKLDAPKQLAEEIGLAVSTMYGFATMRYIVRLEPLASMPTERVVRELAPIVQYRIDRVFSLISIKESNRGMREHHGEATRP